MVYDEVRRVIETERLILRQLKFEDAKEVARLCNNYNLYKTTLCIPYPYTEDDALAWISCQIYNFKMDKMYEFAIVDKIYNTIYGVVSLSNNIKNKNGEIGYWIGEEFWGNDYATEAAKAILDFAFEYKKYHRIYARHFTSNIASGRVMEKIGMKKEGEFIEHIMKDNEFKNVVNYGIVAKREA